MKKDYAPESNEESLGVSRESHDYYAQHARRWRNRVGLGVLTVVLLFWAYVLFVTPFFTIQSVEVFGLNKMQPQEIKDRIAAYGKQKRWGILPRDNIFLFPTNSIAAYFKNDTRIATIHAQKNYRERSLAVSIEERIPIYILSLPDRAFAIDKEGIALIPLSLPPPKGDVPIIVDKRQRETALGGKVIVDDEIQLITTIGAALARLAPFTDVTIGEPSPDAITFTTQEGWGIYFALTDSAEAQLERLRVLLTAKIKPERRKKLQYIDLRFGERTYYR